jgi:hypothetical protein
MEDKEQYRRLRAAYDEAFAKWMSEVQSHPDSALVEEAKQAYRRSRDQLVEFLLDKPGPDQRCEVKSLAYRIWDHSGRPTGTSEADWYKAEQLVTLQTAAGSR